MDLDTAINWALTTIRAIPGIKSVPAYPPEKPAAFPFVMGYPQRSDFMVGPLPLAKGMHVVVIEFHVASKDLPRDVKTSVPYLERIAYALMRDPTWGGTVDQVMCEESNPIQAEFTEFEWGPDLHTLGWRFTVRLKQESIMA